MTKKQRQEIYDKYGGLCAYTGQPLGGDWQVDHIFCRLETTILRRQRDCIDNMVPCLKIINHYKRGLLFDAWRKRIEVLHIRLSKLPKNPVVEKSKKTKQYLLTVAEAFGITPDKPFNGVFYFEQIKKL